MTEALAVLGITIVLLFIGRGVALWYWKVNALLQSLERIEGQLRDVTRILSKAHGIERTEDLAARMNAALGG